MSNKNQQEHGKFQPVSLQKPENQFSWLQSSKVDDCSVWLILTNWLDFCHFSKNMLLLDLDISHWFWSQKAWQSWYRSTVQRERKAQNVLHLIEAATNVSLSLRIQSSCFFSVSSSSRRGTKKGVRKIHFGEIHFREIHFLQEIVDMERYIERVKKSIADKEPPLKVAETRLKKRTQAGSGNFPPWKKTISLPKKSSFLPYFFINFSMQHLLSMITILDSFSWLQQALYNIPPKCLVLTRCPPLGTSILQKKEYLQPEYHCLSTVLAL